MVRFLVFDFGENPTTRLTDYSKRVREREMDVDPAAVVHANPKTVTLPDGTPVRWVEVSFGRGSWGSTINVDPSEYASVMKRSPFKTYQEIRP